MGISGSRAASVLCASLILIMAYLITASIREGRGDSAPGSPEAGRLLAQGLSPLSGEEHAFLRTALYVAQLNAMSRRPVTDRSQPVIRCLTGSRQPHLFPEICTLIERGNYVRLSERLPTKTRGYYEHRDTLFIEVVADSLMVLAILPRMHDLQLYESVKTCVEHNSSPAQLNEWVK